MNKKGFTLVELIAVIAIIGILAVLVTPAIIALRNNVLENTLKAKESTIENAAKDYAMDNLKLLTSPVTNEINVDGMDEDKFKQTYEKNLKELSKDCKWITVNGLINLGYLKGSTSYVNTSDGEKEEQIINPVTGESMNDVLVCVRYDNNDAMNRTIVTIIYRGE